MFSYKQGRTGGTNIAKILFWWNYFCYAYKASYKISISKELPSEAELLLTEFVVSAIN